MRLTDKDKKLINALSKGIPFVLNPFEELAEETELSEEEVLKRIRRYQISGLIRRFGATLRHDRVGFTANAMSVWAISNDRVNEVGNLIASYKEVTHCYERVSHHDWPYNLYAMIHGKSKNECERIAADISKKAGINEYKLLYSTKEFKKTNMEYF